MTKGQEAVNRSQELLEKIEALAQLKHEPVAVVDLRNANYVRWLEGVEYPVEGTKLYTTPPLPVQKPTELANFKNFHRSLCARFNYTHDEKFWWRDLVSLEEHIAKTLPVQRQPLTDDDIAKGYYIDPFKPAIEASHNTEGAKP